MYTYMQVMFDTFSPGCILPVYNFFYFLLFWLPVLTRAHSLTFIHAHARRVLMLVIIHDLIFLSAI